MGNSMHSVHLTVRQDGFSPAAFRWEGRLVRVMAVEAVQTCGPERRYRVRTSVGRFELGFSAQTDAWRVRRSPSRLSQFWARAQQTARYPVPVWRRRARGRVFASPGGSHADGVTVV